VRSALADHCDHLVVGATPRLVGHEQIYHLETRLHGHLRDQSTLLDLVERLHPTPAVGGWPRRAALHWLERHEALERGWYAAPVGWLSAAESGTFAVAIRSALLRDRGALAFVGAGIVPGSVPQAEWHETELKLGTVRSAFQQVD